MTSGTIEQLEDGPRGKCRTWRIRWSLGRDPLTGKYKRGSKQIHGTYREAQRALADAIAANESPKQHDTVLFEDALSSWIEARRVKPSTKAKLQAQGATLCRHLGDVRLCDLTPAAIQHAFDALEAGDSPSGKPLSATYMSGLRTMLGSFLRDAERSHRIESAALLMPETIKQPRTSRTALTGQQVAALVERMEPDDPHHVAVMLALMAGLRRGEAVLTTWDDVDLEAGLLHVPGTKTAASDAVVPITGELVAFLERVPRRSALLVPIEAQSLGEWWYRNRAGFGLDGVTFHSLRHTYVTMLARAGVHPSVMQSLARHADSRTTLEIYTHVQLDQQRAAVDALGGLFSGKSSGK